MLALAYTEARRATEAIPQLARCREIIAAGENWRGLVGTVLRAEAVVQVALCRSEMVSEQFAIGPQGLMDAQSRFAQSLEIFHRNHAVVEETETLYECGRPLVAVGEQSAGNAKLDEAIATYRCIGIGQRWVERAQAQRAQTSAAPLRDKANVADFRKEGRYWVVGCEGASHEA